MSCLLFTTSSLCLLSNMRTLIGLILLQVLVVEVITKERETVFKTGSEGRNRSVLHEVKSGERVTYLFDLVGVRQDEDSNIPSVQIEARGKTYLVTGTDPDSPTADTSENDGKSRTKRTATHKKKAGLLAAILRGGGRRGGCRTCEGWHSGGVDSYPTYQVPQAQHYPIETTKVITIERKIPVEKIVHVPVHVPVEKKVPVYVPVVKEVPVYIHHGNGGCEHPHCGAGRPLKPDQEYQPRPVQEHIQPWGENSGSYSHSESHSSSHSESWSHYKKK